MTSTPEALLVQGFQARKEHRLADAWQNFSDAADAARRENSALPLAQALTQLGYLARNRHEVDAARMHYEEAAAVYRTLDDPLRLAHTVRHVGDILREDKQLEPAGPCYREALEIYRAHEDTPPLDLANAIRGYALLKAETGERQDAIALWQEAGELYAQVHVEAGVAESERRVALLMGG